MYGPTPTPGQAERKVFKVSGSKILNYVSWKQNICFEMHPVCRQQRVLVQLFLVLTWARCVQTWPNEPHQED